ncbi:MAG: class I SAM-dependent methyltransferase [Chitinophagaceae bacterium]
MNRVTAIQALMRRKNLNHYLEIGVFNGHNFFRIKSTFKVAVDPDFKFDVRRKIGKTILNPYNLYNQYFQKTSDDFFLVDAPRVFAHKQVNIALIDGMHEYGFALRDVENVLHYLSDDGVIILHDCHPQTPEEAVSFEKWKARGFTGIWSGDVWKTILHLRSLRNDLDVFVLDCDQGLGMVQKRKPENAQPENSLPFCKAEINQFTFDDFQKNKTVWLNLQPEKYFYSYFNIKK